MSYIPRKNLQTLLNTEFARDPQYPLLPFLSFLPKLSPKLCLILALLSYFLNLYTKQYPNPSFRLIQSLLLPLSLSIFIHKSENRLQPLKFFEDFSASSLYFNLLGLSLTCVYSEPRLQFCILCAVQSMLYSAPWQDLNSPFIRSSPASMIPELCLFFITLLLLDQVFIINLADLEIFSFSVSELFSYSLLTYSTVKVLYTVIYAVFISERGKLMGLVPLLMLNLNLYAWTHSEIFGQWPNMSLLAHTLLASVILIKIKVFAAVRIDFYYTHAEIVIESFFLVQEFGARVVPRHPTFALLVMVYLVRYSSLFLMISKQIKSLKVR